MSPTGIVEGGMSVRAILALCSVAMLLLLGGAMWVDWQLTHPEEDATVIVNNPHKSCLEESLLPLVFEAIDSLEAKGVTELTDLKVVITGKRSESP